MKRWPLATIMLALLAPAAQAQFSLYQGSCTGTPVGQAFDFGSVYPNQLPDAAAFCLLNSTASTQTVALLSVTGSGFTLTGAVPGTVGPATPMTLKANGSVPFTVTFNASTPGYHPGSLAITGISVLLTATVVEGLSYEVQLGSETSALGAAGVDFGNVQVGSSTTLNFLVVNRTASSLTVDPISVAAGEFALVAPSPAGTALAAGASAPFTIAFQPTAVGPQTAALTIGAMRFTLTGTGVAAAVATVTPVLTVTPKEAQSAQQGTVAVSFAAAQTGSGKVTLAFAAQVAGQLDPGIAFSSGGTSAPFTFNAGDTAASFNGAPSVGFQTGTTAGTLTVQAQIGNQESAPESIVIAPAIIAVAAATGTRQTSAVTVNVTGFDNTRSAGLLTFTFYDSGGKVIPPGAIAYSATVAFSGYFAASGDGGQFALSAYFPVLDGNPSQVGAFTVELANSTGTVTTARTSF
jgi:hypothetical protein